MFFNLIFSFAITESYQGQLPPNLGLAPKCDIEQCLTNSKHRYIGAKERYVAFKIHCTSRYISGTPLLRELMTLPRFPSRFGRGHPSPFPTLLGASILLFSALPIRRLDFWVIAPKYVCIKPLLNPADRLVEFGLLHSDKFAKWRSNLHDQFYIKLCK